jgi:hypothetical protein
LPKATPHRATKRIEPGVAITGQDDRTIATSDDNAAPEWMRQTPVTAGDTTLFVLSSKQYATEDEGRKELAGTAREMLKKDFERQYGIPARSLSDSDLPAWRIQQLALRQEYIETLERDFGNFTAPMHRVWWQLELSPKVRSGIYPVWRTHLQEWRSALVGGGLAGTTLVLAGWSVFRRRKDVTNQRRFEEASSAADASAKPH